MSEQYQPAAALDRVRVATDIDRATLQEVDAIRFQPGAPRVLARAEVLRDLIAEALAARLARSVGA